MHRVLAPLLLAASLTCAELPSDGELLAAARSADQTYQLHLADLRDRLADPELDDRLAAIRHIGGLQDPAALPPLLGMLENTKLSIDEQQAIAAALGSSGSPVGIPALRKLTVGSDAGTRLAAYNALAALRADSAGDHTQRARDADEQPHLAGLTNLGTIKQADAAPLLIAGLAKHPRAIVRRQCAIGLARLGDPANGPALQTALSDPDAGVRRYSAEGIAKLNYRPAIPFMLMALDANIAGTEINRALQVMTGQDFGFDPSADALHRKEAIDRGFAWWTQHANDG